MHPTLNMSINELLAKVPLQMVRRVIPFRDGHLIPLGLKTHVIAILNITPDSFSDGGTFFHEAQGNEDLPAELKDRLVKFHEACTASGVTFVDVGGASSRPGASHVPTEEEIRRVVPVIRFLRSMPHSLPISIDTASPEVAAAAVDEGVCIINDISANLDVVRTKRPADVVIVMHNRGSPSTMTSLKEYPGGVLEDVVLELYEKVQEWIKIGYRRWQVIVDPGIGFAKGVIENMALIKEMDVFKEKMGGYPVLVGHSRKKFIDVLMNQTSLVAQDRDFGTAALAVANVEKGVDFIRAHAFTGLTQAVRVSDAVYRPENVQQQ